jgi:dTDP-4-amino-4,6-dideoxygalactose transaminase
LPHRSCRRRRTRRAPITLPSSIRAALAAHLDARGVQTAINYPTALPFLEAYSRLRARREQFPDAHRDQGKILLLPMFAEITGDQRGLVIDLVREF